MNNSRKSQRIPNPIIPIQSSSMQQVAACAGSVHKKSTEMASTKPETSTPQNSNQIDKIEANRSQSHPSLHQIRPIARPQAISRDGTINKATQMAATIKSIKSELACKRPLRQINIVGQLNHSANRGMLLIVANSLLVLSAMLVSGPQAANAVVWPFSMHRAIGSAANVSSNLWPFSSLLSQSRDLSSPTTSETSGFDSTASRRTSRHSPPSTGLAQQQQQPQQNAAASNLLPAQSPPPPPMTQQFHYFWNHDQIEPNAITREANKILAEAQLQTDQMALTGAAPNGKVAHSTATNSMNMNDATSASSPSLAMTYPTQSFSPNDNNSSAAQTISRQDSAPSSTSSAMLASESSPMSSMTELGGPDPLQEVIPAPISIPPHVQQQLTSMVLQMQRQQQMSMMMQPQFDPMGTSAAASAAAQAIAAQRRASSGGSAPAMLPPPPMNPFNPMSRYWMAGSQQQQQQPHPMDSAAATMAALSHYAAAATVPVGAFALPPTGPPAISPRGSMAGVPVYGPYSIAPSIAPRVHPFPMIPPMSNPFQRANTQNNNNNHSNGNSNHSSRLSRLSNRRRSWPLFGGGSSGSSSHMAAASQPRPSISMPPSSSSGRASSSQPPLELPPDSLALLDFASNQLANAIVGQSQARSVQRKLAAALSHAAQQVIGIMANDQRQSEQQSADLATSASTASAGLKPRSVSQVVSGRQANEMFTGGHQPKLQPPYLYHVSSTNPAPRVSNQLDMFGHPMPTQNFDTVSHAFNGSNIYSDSYGNRLKRRHLAALSDVRQQQANFDPTRMSPNSAKLPFIKTQPAPYAINKFTSNGKDSNSTMADYYYNAATGNDSYRLVTTDATPTNLEEFDRTLKMNEFARIRQKATVRPRQVVSSAKKEVAQKAQVNAKQNASDIFTQMIKLQNLTASMADDSSAEKQTQVRRLKRSIDVGDATKLHRVHRDVSKFSSLTSNSGGWKSIGSLDEFIVPNKPAANRQSDNTTLGLVARPIPYVLPSSAWTVSTGNSVAFEPTRQVGQAVKSDLVDSSATGVLRRQAEVSSVNEAAGTSKAVEAKVESKPASETVVAAKQEQTLSDTESRRGRAFPINHKPYETPANSIQDDNADTKLKIKRINAGASVLHNSSGGHSDRVHQRAQSQHKSDAVDAKDSSSKESPKTSTTESIVGTLIEPVVQASTQSSAPTTTMKSAGTKQSIPDDSTTDPMAAYLSESNRVINYFQNVENEPTALSTSASRSTSQIGSNGNSQLHINVGFSAPIKTSSTTGVSQASSSSQQSSSSQTNDGSYKSEEDLLRRQTSNQPQSNSASQQQKGNFQELSSGTMHVGSGDYGLNTMQNSRQVTGGSTQAALLQQQQQTSRNGSMGNKSQQLQQQMQQQVAASLAGASSTDITSAATGSNLAYVNGGGASSKAGVRFGSLQVPRQTTQIMNRKTMTLNSRVPSESSFLSATVAQPAAGKSSGSDAAKSSASGQLAQQSNVNGVRVQMDEHPIDRSPLADQSNNFNEELVAPQLVQNQPSDSSQSNANTNLLMSADGRPFEPVQEVAFDPSQQFGGGSSLTAAAVAAQQQQQPPSAFAANPLEQQQSNLFMPNSFNHTGAELINSDENPIYRQQSFSPTQNHLAQIASFNQQQATDTAAAQLMAAQSHQQNAPQPMGHLQYSNFNRYNSMSQPIDTAADSSGAAAAALLRNMSPQAARQILVAAMHSLDQHTAAHQPVSYMSGLMHGPPMPTSASYLNPTGAATGVLGTEEDVAAGAATAAAAAAAGITNYSPAMLHHPSLATGAHLSEMQANLLMAGSENRESGGEEDSSSSGANKKKGAKKRGTGKQVNHYHFNSFGSPFEDPESPLSLNPLDLANQIHIPDPKARPVDRPNKPQEDSQQDEEQEARKQKRKGFLRRFSFKNLFKRFKKDKTKDPANQNEESGNDSQGNGQIGSSDKRLSLYPMM